MSGERRSILSDLGPRLELMPMDRHCQGVSVALYLTVDGTAATVHSFSGRPLVPPRLTWISRAMSVLGGMNLDVDERTVRFGCGQWHESAARRIFLEACRADPASPVLIRALASRDSRTGQQVTAMPLGAGAYRVDATGGRPGAVSRGPAVAAGLVRLVGVEVDPGDPSVIHFACGTSHDELVGLLLPRAINLRAALGDPDDPPSRGIMVAPTALEAVGRP